VCLICIAGSAFAQEQAPSAEELFRRHFAQLGSSQALAQAKSAVVSGILKRSGTDYPFSLTIGGLGSWRIETRDESGKALVYGRSPQEKPWVRERGRVRDLEGEPVIDPAALTITYDLSIQRFMQHRLGDAVCETEQVRHRPAFAIGRRHGPRRFRRLYFDAQTGLLVRVGHLLLDDYRSVAGINVPHAVRFVDGSLLQVTSIRHSADSSRESFAARKSGGGLLAAAAPMIGGALQQQVTLLSGSGRMEIVRHPAPAGTRQYQPREIPRFDPNSAAHAQVPLQGLDLRRLELADRALDFLHADFDTRTQWPKRLPQEFSPTQVLDLGKNPGLGLRRVHERGITGKGVGIAVVDFPLLTEHVEYAERLRLYEEIESSRGQAAHMHGCAVASIALGKSCGVAPGADLYFIASRNARVSTNGMVRDFRPIARSINRLLDLNEQLALNRRIRAIALAMGWDENDGGYAEMNAAVARATSNRVFVISSSSRETHGLWFDGLYRPATADPNCFESYGPGSWWAQVFWSGEMRFKPGKRLCVPMDGRTVASPAGANDYVHYDSAGWSWAIPWIAGLYALACEVCPDITPERFWAEALRTSVTLQLKHRGETIPFGAIANPIALLEALQTTSPAAVALDSPQDGTPCQAGHAHE
jgi:hypothetical protein